jgi:protein-S-isoprenylcysteine O-methyltransferase Ste14
MPQALSHYFTTAWAITGLVWLVGAFTAKPVARSQSRASRYTQTGWLIIVLLLLFRTSLRLGPLDLRFIPPSLAAAYTGLFFTIAGLGLAIWARFRLGGNWSAKVTIKKDHSLVRTGPYSIVRHPIYSGFLLAILGTALATGTIRSLVALAVILVSFKSKANLEERFMIYQFGAEYLQYRREVKSLIPFVL